MLKIAAATDPEIRLQILQMTTPLSPIFDPGIRLTAIRGLTQKSVMVFTSTFAVQASTYNPTDRKSALKAAASRTSFPQAILQSFHEFFQESSPTETTARSLLKPPPQGFSIGCLSALKSGSPAL